jgi:hypothetical protein
MTEPMIILTGVLSRGGVLGAIPVLTKKRERTTANSGAVAEP